MALSKYFGWVISLLLNHSHYKLVLASLAACGLSLEVSHEAMQASPAALTAAPSLQRLHSHVRSCNHAHLAMASGADEQL